VGGECAVIYREREMIENEGGKRVRAGQKVWEGGWMDKE